MKKIIQKYQKELGYAVVTIIVSFYGGMKYDQSKSAVLTSANGNGGQARMNSAGGQRGLRGAFNGASGSIVAKDATSITVSIRDGSGSKIIFISPSTTVNKQVDGTTSDLIVGKEVSVAGIPNPDGSINAQSIQLRLNFATSTTR